MVDSEPATPSSTSAGRTPDLPSVLRFSTELVAWIAAPWALASHSVALAVVSVVVLVGLPTIFATPGDKAQVLVAVPGVVTIFLVVLQLVAAVVSSWVAWPAVVAIVVTVLAAATVVTERPRWRRLAARPVGR